MKLIGITGKSGAGKTTLTDMLGQNENVGVIHTDELMHKMEKEKLPQIMEKNKNGETIAVKKSIRKLIYENKYIFLIFIRVKGFILNRKIERKIEEFQKEGKDIVVIESIHLKYLNVFKKLDKKILMERPYKERLESVLVRDKDKNIDKETFALWDLPYKRSYYKEKNKNNYCKIDNTSIEKLRQVADEIYKEMSQNDEMIRRKKFLRKYEYKVNTLTKNNKENTSYRDKNMTKKGKEDDSNETR